jgi:F-type H+-transporting ATPase subunit epsilon
MMHLKITLPYKVFADVKNVKRILVETSEGYYGLLPQRLDCIAVLVAGVFTYETEAGTKHYIALDEGVLIKKGEEVNISVRNAIAGNDLGKLHEAVEKEFKALDENEKNMRFAIAKLESSFMLRLKKFQNSSS